MQSLKILVTSCAVSLVLGLSSCGNDDYVDIDNMMSGLENRIETLETFQEKVVAFKNLVDASVAGYFIISVEDISDGEGGIIGYRITFSNGDVISLTDGTDGNTPVISVAEYDGVLCWQVNGQWLTDGEDKIPVQGKTPQFKILNGKWMISFGNNEWRIIERSPTGINSSVEVKEFDDYYSFTIDGVTGIDVAKYQGLDIVFSCAGSQGTEFEVSSSMPAVINFEIIGLLDNQTPQIKSFVTGDYSVETAVVGQTGTITVSRGRGMGISSDVDVNVILSDGAQTTIVRRIHLKAGFGIDPEIGYVLKDGVYYTNSEKGLLALAAMTKNSPSINITLVSDISLTEPWIMIGSKMGIDKEYHGVFDGNNHIISGLRINENATYVGMFACVKYGTIKNVILDSPIVNGSSIVGALVGEMYDSTVENCHVIGNASVTSDSPTVGGVVGSNAQNYDSTEAANIIACSFAGTVDCNDSNQGGGIVGKNAGYIIGCYADAVINGDSRLSGIVGSQSSAKGKLSGCCFRGSINPTSTNFPESGFLIGKVWDDIPVLDCFYMGMEENTIPVFGGDKIITNQTNVQEITVDFTWSQALQYLNENQDLIDKGYKYVEQTDGELFPLCIVVIE